jgi:peptidoglycan/LPS O-acetylase OafA/YrhL
VTPREGGASPAFDTVPVHRRLDIQGLRAIAVFLVVAFHAGLPVPGGFVGVDLFFVISGFVITGLLLRQWNADGQIDFGRFYARRIRRLLPALALVVAITCVGSILVQSPNGAQQQTAQTAIGAMLIAANVIVPRLSDDYFGWIAAHNPLMHTWSLSVEEQFYLVYPGLLVVGLVAARWLRNQRAAAVPVVLTTLGSGVLMLVLAYAPTVIPSSAGLLSAFFSSPARAWEFGAGALVALLAERCVWPGAARLAAGVLGAFFAIGPAFVLTEHTTFPGIAAFAPVVGTTLILAAGIGGVHPVSRILSAGPLVWAGDLSYSWYLWHWPLIVFSKRLFPDVEWATLVAAILSLPVAFLSFRFVESPTRAAPAAPGRRVGGLAVLTTAAVVLLAGGLGLGAKSGWGQSWTLGAHVAMQRGCDSEFDPVQCRWTSGNGRRFVLLLGDSQAWALADGLIPAADGLGLDTIVAASNACPFALRPAAPAKLDGLSSACEARNQQLVQYALEQRPQVVVIANQSLAYSAARESWRASLSPAVRRLRASAIGVVIVHVVPLGDEQNLQASLLFRPSGGSRFTLLASQKSGRANADTAERMVADENPGTVVFDPATLLCPDGRCRVAYEGTEYYTDRNHLSRPGALLLESGLHQALRESSQIAELHAVDPTR